MLLFFVIYQNVLRINIFFFIRPLIIHAGKKKKKRTNKLGNNFLMKLKVLLLRQLMNAFNSQWLIHAGNEKISKYAQINWLVGF